MELVSVIVPIYNVEAYLRRCLDSLVQQTYGNLEILLINDGSIDGSLHIAEEYAGMYDMVHVISQENQGLSGARNTGLAHATGSLIFFVDSDDYISLNAVEKLVEAIEGYDVAELKNVKFDELGNETAYEYHSPIDIGMYDLQTNREKLFQVAMFVRGNMYRREFIDGLQFPVGLVHEDIYFSTILFEKLHRINYVDNAVYYYFIRSDSIMNKANNKMFDMFKVMKLLCAYYENHHLEDYTILEKVYVRNFMIATMFKKAATIDSTYYEERERICNEAIDFLDMNLSGYRKNPYVTFKEKLAISLLRLPIARKWIWR